MLTEKSWKRLQPNLIVIIMKFNDFRVTRRNEKKDNIARQQKENFYYIRISSSEEKMVQWVKVKKRHSRNKVYKRRGKNKKSKSRYQTSKVMFLFSILRVLVNKFWFWHTIANEYWLWLRLNIKVLRRWIIFDQQENWKMFAASSSSPYISFFSFEAKPACNFFASTSICFQTLLMNSGIL